MVLAGCSSVMAAEVLTEQPTQSQVEATEEATATSLVVTATEAPSTTPTTTNTPTPDAPPDRITDAHGVEMVLIPEGEFTMGSEAGFPDEVPVHPVWVDAFYIDLTEVTNGQYRECVDAGVCAPPRLVECCPDVSGARTYFEDYFTNPEYDNYPVVYISWYDAYDFCTWRGGRLATEAEWEKASRGTDARTYPWGNDEPTPEHLNFMWPPGTFGDQRPVYTVTPVGSYPKGASPYGVLDLAGNVYEWLWDRYDPAYYSYSPYENPQGPETGDFRLTRGGSFWNQAFRNRSANRNNAYIPADSVHFDGGARCAADVE